jgi:hypothetical protein
MRCIRVREIFTLRQCLTAKHFLKLVSKYARSREIPPHPEGGKLNDLFESRGLQTCAELGFVTDNWHSAARAGLKHRQLAQALFTQGDEAEPNR